MAIKFLNSVAVDADVLFVDTANERVGIGTTSPSEKLHVVGGSGLIESTTYADAGFTVSDDIYDYRIGTTPPQIRTNYIAIKRSASSTYFNQSSGNFVWNTGLSEKMRITSAGNVGIGTTSPQAKFVVSNNGAAGMEFQPELGTDTNRILNYDRITSTYMNLRLDANAYQFRISGSEKVTITSTGNVGIGTTAPSTPLHINADAPTLRLQDATSGDNHYLTGNNGEFRVQSSGYITMRPGAAVSTTFLANGNVGIGTTSPDYPLHVDDTIKIGDRQGTDGSLILQSQQGPNITFKSTGDVLDISGTTGATNGNSIRLSDNIKKLYFNGGIGGTIAINRGNRGLMDSNVGGLEVQQQDTVSSNGKSTFLSTSSLGTILRSTSYGSTGTSGDIQFQFGGGANTSEPSPTTKMVIKNSGNVGIGTTSPNSILHITDANPEFILEDTTNPNRSKIKNNDGSLRYEADYNSQMGNSKHQFFIDGSEKLRINTDGNVGIGTTSPSAALEVVGGIKLSDNSPLTWATSNTRIFGQSGYMQLQVASVDVMRLASSGNVGIGTTSPATKLHVQGGASGYLFRVQGTSTLNVYDPGAAAEIGIGSSSGDKLKLFSNDSINNGITIDTSGNVGIGTTSPSEKLEVTGPIGSTKLTGYKLIFTRNANNEIFTEGASSTLTLGTNSVERMRITSAGNVGIGTTTPGKLLEVKSSTAYNSTVRLSTTAHNWDIQGGEAGYSSTAFALDYDGTTFFRAMGTTDARFGGGLSVGTINATPPTGGLYVAGNVGIGTTSPGAKLDVEATTSPQAKIGYDANNYVQVSVNGVGDTSIAPTGNGIIAADLTLSAGSAYVKLDAQTNNVGIGTTSPDRPLSVVGGNSMVARFQSTNTTSFIQLSNTVSTADQVRIGSNGTNLVLSTNYAERMRITSAGDAGIGVTTPRAKLDVDGGIKVANDTDTPSANKEGTLRYRLAPDVPKSQSMVDMCMKTGPSSYAWVNIVTNTWNN